MKHLHSTFIFLIITFLFLSSCKKKEKEKDESSIVETPTLTPVVVTSPISNITDTSAVSGGTVTSEGASAITAVGICWDTLPSPTTLKQKTMNGAGVGNYISNIGGLKVNKKYYVRAYASNGNGTAYGNEINFLSPVINVWEKINLPFTHINCMKSDGGEVYVGSETGIFFSSDSGKTWSSKGLSDKQITTILKADAHLYAVTSEYDAFTSNNNGASWSSLKTNLPYDVRVSSVAFHNGKLFISSDSSVFCSATNGASWTKSGAGLYKQISLWTTIETFNLISDQQNLYVFNRQPEWSQLHLFKYNESTQNWEKLLNLGNSKAMTSHKIANKTNFILRNNVATTSKDGGVSWSTINTTSRGMDVYKQNVVLSGQSSIQVSKNSGATWVTIKFLGIPSNANLGQIFISENYLWINTSEGLYKCIY